MLTREAIKDFTKIASERTSCTFTSDGKCHKDKCPLWWNFRWKMENTEDRSVENFDLIGCGHVLLPVLMNDLIGTSYYYKDSVEGKVNEFQQDFLQMQKKTNFVLAGVVSSMKDQKLIKPSIFTTVKRKLLGTS